MLLINPPAINQDGRPVLALQWRNDHVPVRAVAHARADQHLLVMAETARGVDAAIVKVVNGFGVDGWGQGEGLAEEAVFEFGDEVGLPAETLDLP